MNREEIKDRICKAISERKVIRFYYGSGERLVEPYVCGISRTNKLVLIGFQVGERGSGLRRFGWHMFDVVNISYLGVTKKEFNISRISPRRPFNPLTSRMEKIFCSAIQTEPQGVERLPEKRSHAAAK
jgi:hypothetical protein